MVYKRVKGWTSGRSFPRHSLPNGVPCRLFTVPFFRRKIVEIERYALRVAILDEYQKYFAGGGFDGLGGSEKNIFLVPLPLELHV